MPRYRHPLTKVVVNVAEGKAMPGYKLIGDEVEESAGTGYQALKVADLRAEIERRNEGRDPEEQLSADGKKADLVAALEADDQASTGGAHAAPADAADAADAE